MKKNTVHAFRVRTAAQAFMIKMEALVIIKQAYLKRKIQFSMTKNTIIQDEKYKPS